MTRKVQPGQRWQPPPAAQQNAWDEAAEDYARNHRLSEGGPPQLRRPISTDVIKIKNDTGDDLSRGAVVRLSTTPLYRTAAIWGGDGLQPDKIWLSGVTPQDSFTTWGRYGILRDPVKYRGIGPCQVSGVCVAKIDVRDTDDRFATWADDSTLLVSTDAGQAVCELLQSATSTGEQNLAVRLMPAPPEPAVWTGDVYGLPYGWIDYLAGDPAARVTITGDLTPASDLNFWYDSTNKSIHLLRKRLYLFSVTWVLRPRAAGAGLAKYGAYFVGSIQGKSVYQGWHFPDTTTQQGSSPYDYVVAPGQTVFQQEPIFGPVTGDGVDIYAAASSGWDTVSVIAARVKVVML